MEKLLLVLLCVSCLQIGYAVSLTSAPLRVLRSQTQPSFLEVNKEDKDSHHLQAAKVVRASALLGGEHAATSNTRAQVITAVKLTQSATDSVATQTHATAAEDAGLAADQGLDLDALMQQAATQKAATAQKSTSTTTSTTTTTTTTTSKAGVVTQAKQPTDDPNATGDLGGGNLNAAQFDKVAAVARAPSNHIVAINNNKVKSPQETTEEMRADQFEEEVKAQEMLDFQSERAFNQEFRQFGSSEASEKTRKAAKRLKMRDQVARAVTDLDRDSIVKAREVTWERFDEERQKDDAAQKQVQEISLREEATKKVQEGRTKQLKLSDDASQRMYQEEVHKNDEIAQATNTESQRKSSIESDQKEELRKHMSEQDRKVDNELARATLDQATKLQTAATAAQQTGLAQNAAFLSGLQALRTTQT